MTDPDPLYPAAADLEASWSRRVRAEREQVERLREVEDGPDFYGPSTARFRADPRRRDDPTLDVLLALARPGETWLDVGAGAGRYALPLALAVRDVVAVDPSPGMLAALGEGMAEHGIGNVRAIEDRWPPSPGSAAAGLRADVALIANVGHDVAEIGTFLDALEAAAGRLCVAVMAERAPSSAVDALWPEVVGEARLALPALPELEAILLARGRLFEVRLVERTGPGFGSLDEALAFTRRQLWARPGSERDRRLAAALPGFLEEREGRLAIGAGPGRSGVVSWVPGPAGGSA